MEPTKPVGTTGCFWLLGIVVLLTLGLYVLIGVGTSDPQSTGYDPPATRAPSDQTLDRGDGTGPSGYPTFDEACTEMASDFLRFGVSTEASIVADMLTQNCLYTGGNQYRYIGDS